jgi:hypothetical protein
MVHWWVLGHIIPCFDNPEVLGDLLNAGWLSKLGKKISKIVYFLLSFRVRVSGVRLSGPRLQCEANVVAEFKAFIGVLPFFLEKGSKIVGPFTLKGKFFSTPLMSKALTY